MSTRTIIEINHDYMHDLRDTELQVLPLLLKMLQGGIGANARDWNRDLGLPGVRILAQRHHSEPLDLKVR